MQTPFVGRTNFVYSNKMVGGSLLVHFFHEFGNSVSMSQVVGNLILLNDDTWEFCLNIRQIYCLKSTQRSTCNWMDVLPVAERLNGHFKINCCIVLFQPSKFIYCLSFYLTQFGLKHSAHFQGFQKHMKKVIHSAKFCLKNTLIWIYLLCYI